MPTEAQLAHAERMMTSMGGTKGMGKLMNTKKMKKAMKKATSSIGKCSSMNVAEMQDLMDEATKSGILKNKRLQEKVKMLNGTVTEETVQKMTRDVMEDTELLNDIMEKSEGMIEKAMASNSGLRKIIDSTLETATAEIMKTSSKDDSDEGEEKEENEEFLECVRSMQTNSEGKPTPVFVQRIEAKICEKAQKAKTVLTLVGTDPKGQETVAHVVKQWSKKMLMETMSTKRKAEAEGGSGGTFLEFAKSFDIQKTKPDAVVAFTDAFCSVQKTDPVPEAMGGDFIVSACQQMFLKAGGKVTAVGAVVVPVGTAVMVASPIEALACRRLIVSVARPRAQIFDTRGLAAAVRIARDGNLRNLLVCVDKNTPAEGLEKAIHDLESNFNDFETVPLKLDYCCKIK